MKKEILAIIPARGGSKGIPNKNLAALCGLPLIQYTIDAAKESSFVSRIILSSDDETIINYCKEKIEVPFVRPECIARDDSAMIDVIKHALDFLKDKENYFPDYVLLLQPTSPLRTKQHIDESLKLLVASDADSIVSVVSVPHNFTPTSIMEFDGKYLKHHSELDERNIIRQKKPQFFGRNGPAILAFKCSSFIEKKSMYGDKILPYLMKKEESIDIDDFFDFRIAEHLLTKRK